MQCPTNLFNLCRYKIEPILLHNPKYKVTLNIINDVAVSFECNSTPSFKTLQLQVVIPIKYQFIQLSLNQCSSFPSFKLSTCPTSNVQEDFWACTINQDPSGVSKANRSHIVIFQFSFINLRYIP